LAKEENDMNFFAREKARQQTEWGNTWDGKTWFAYIDAPITDLAIIEDAKWMWIIAPRSVMARMARTRIPS